MTTNLSPGARSFSVLPSAARTASPAAQDLNLPRATGLVLVVDATTVTATGTLTVLVEGVDRESGKTWTLLQSASISSASTVVLRIHPQLEAADNTVAKDVVPPYIRVTATQGNAVSLTYSVTGYLTN